MIEVSLIFCDCYNKLSVALQISWTLFEDVLFTLQSAAVCSLCWPAKQVGAINFQRDADFRDLFRKEKSKIAFNLVLLNKWKKVNSQLHGGIPPANLATQLVPILIPSIDTVTSDEIFYDFYGEVHLKSNYPKRN